ncbi:MAG: diguanylate cyclase [Magnetospirillum sp. WYHS-4]
MTTLRHLTGHLRDLAAPLLVGDTLRDLMSGGGHSPYLKRHRAAVIVDRVRLVSGAFAILTPLWILVDALVLPWPAWGVLAGVRVFSSLLFAVLAIPWEIDRTPRLAMVMLAGMLVNPPLFYLAALPLFGGVALGPVGEVVAALYALLPFVMVAGLAVFPLTIAEAVAFALPVVILTAVGAAFAIDFTWPAYIGKLWLLALILGVGGVSGVGQLRYMIALVSRASQDPLTGVFTRRSGAEIIDLQFRMAMRQDTPFAVLFVDLDNFKSVNDVYGHEAGDATLRVLVAGLKNKLRRGDVIVRWGGEEFVVVLGNIDCQGVRLVLRRMLDEWFGLRPDGLPLTASLGIAERQADGINDWNKLIELADQRMYQAKKAGKARAVVCGGAEMT